MFWVLELNKIREQVVWHVKVVKDWRMLCVGDLLRIFSLETAEYVPNYIPAYYRNLLVYNITSDNNSYTVP
jgi:hypothetical protein